jgi:hypothetical protein
MHLATTKPWVMIVVSYLVPMASILKKVTQFQKEMEKTYGDALFRHVPGIEALKEEKLNELGYYTGFPCPHNHLIRDSTHHWCYECVNKILSNVCGFDLNYLNAEYRIKYGKLWKSVQIGFPEECWEIKSPGGTTPKRVCMPSYRSEYSKQKSDNVNIHKALYQCAWGDVGDLKVTRLCGNAKCGNPLHLVSSFNRTYPPQTISPLEVEFKAEKLMLYNRRMQAGLEMEPLNRQGQKNAITNPEYVKDRPEYNE